ncbi:hypothetical protein SELMODRAFT_420255 [Selaginella moellendorffii]|uniref:Uncharacterized protein n=1 Tax=Selaginella moellendorffii TaxID=88036 RepID=D8SBF1_SELML|nr:hypothetical protein SELMODRAFT_420255 [Selaginella moellendorffii]
MKSGEGRVLALLSSASGFIVNSHVTNWCLQIFFLPCSLNVICVIQALLSKGTSSAMQNGARFEPIKCPSQIDLKRAHSSHKNLMQERKNTVLNLMLYDFMREMTSCLEAIEEDWVLGIVSIWSIYTYFSADGEVPGEELSSE